MATPLFDPSAILNTIIGLLGPLITLLIIIQVIKMIISMLGGLAPAVGGGP